ncbi:hypothetical protein G4G28_00795 [Massilia sp. Dwa41.01b]|uniref:hypothetical protein n=1 Tax=unclassified Massilia TaxID=2609279 RepID=UPI00160141C0|nr:MULTISPECIES: hypothetical protein [unclassified Massilia]QNA87367.1 hypothetical protein G4G28_00795 [Massilia sp. Dwa41.01b]QNA98273.1 hypothetical protein G4G31_04555 [Massilia sp. Se16.2.3]
MQQAPRTAPSAGFNLLLGVLLGALGVFHLATGAQGDGLGGILKGLALLAYALVLVRDALHIRKTGQPAMPRRRLNTIGLACLALYFVGVLVKNGPAMM